MKKSCVAFLWILCVLNAQSQDRSAELVIPIGHTSGITSVDISPDGRYYLTGSLDRTAKIWDRNGYEIRTLVGHENNVLAVAFSPVTELDPLGGKFILTGSSDRTAILWDKFGNKLGTFKDPASKADVTTVAFSPNGKELLIGLKDGSARILNDSCKEIFRFQHKNELHAVAYSPKGDYILTACADQTAVLWKRKDNNRPFRTFAGHKAAVLSIAFSSTGDTILTGGADGGAKLWTVSGQKIRDFDHAAMVHCVSWAYADGQPQIITGSSDGTFKVWNLGSQMATPVRLYNRSLDALKLSSDGKLLLSGSGANPVAKIAQLDGNTLGRLSGYTSSITSLAISPDGSSLLVGHADSTAKIWDLSNQTITAVQHPGRLESVAFSPINAEDSIGGKIILTGCEDNICRVQNRSDKTIQPLAPANMGVFSLDGRFALTGSAEGATKLWDLATMNSSPVEHSERSVTALAFSPVPGSKAFAIGAFSGSVVYWDSIGAVPVSFKLSPPAPINALAFSADGNALVCGSKSGQTEIRNIAGKQLKAYPNRNRGIQPIRALAYAPRGSRTAVGAGSVLRATGKNAELWNITTDEIISFKGHVSVVSAVAFSPQGDLVYTGSEDGTVKIWDAASGKEIATLVSIGNSDWAITTPPGLYDASPAAMKRMHYVVGMDVVVLRQIKERFWDPGLMAKVTGFSQDTIRSLPDLGNVPMYPEINMKIEGNKLNIRLVERNGGLGRVSLYINNKRIETDINPGRVLKLAPIDLDQDKYIGLYRSDTANTIGITTYNAGNWLRSPVIELPYQPVGARGTNTNNPNLSPSDCKSSKPHLYLIVVGTSKYQDASKNLAYPDHDATEMAMALSSAGKAMLGAENVHLQLLSTAGGNTTLSSKENIRAAFEAFAQKATPCDVLVVYFSGHGSTWASDAIKKSFYYLTKDISSEKLRDADIRNAYAISDADLETWLNKIRAQKQVLIIDACNSGQAASIIGGIGQRDLATQNFAMGILNDRTGALIMTGSLADMVSFEANKYGHGLLTYSLLKGMSGPGLKSGKIVDVMTLFQHARQEVPILAERIKQKQTPVIASGGDSFPIGIVDSSVHITLLEEKPVFIQSKFILLSNNYFNDTLGGIGLAKSLNNYFFEQNAKGAEAKYVFYDIPELTEGYSVKGTYEIVGKIVQIKGNLFKGDKQIGASFEVSTENKLIKARGEILKIILPRISKS